MSTMDLSNQIAKLKKIEKSFNATNDPVQRYALIQALNHIGRKEIPFDDDHWFMKQYYDATLRKYGADIP